MSTETHLLAIVLLPLVGAIGIALTGARPNLREGVTLVTAAGLAALVWSMIPELLANGRPAVGLWQIMPGISIGFTLEPLGMLFAALASMLWIVNSVYSIGYMRGNKEKNQTRFYVCFAIALGATMGIALAGNLLTLFIFYELLTLSTYPLVAHKGDRATVAQARVYIGVLLGTSIALLLPAIIWTYQLTGTLEFTPGGTLEGRIVGPAVGLLLALYVFGIGKAAVMPVHRWLPAAMVAPTPVSALLHAVAVVKAGVFGLLRVIYNIFGVDLLAVLGYTSWLALFASFTIVAASLLALAQSNLKLRLAYSTVSQLSYIVLAASLLTPLAALAAIAHIANQAFAKITMFFVAGAVERTTGRTHIHELAGIGRVMPWTMGAFTVAALSFIGLPLFAGFITKWFLSLGALQAGAWWFVLLMVASSLLNAAYWLPILYLAWFRESRGLPRGVHEAGALLLVPTLISAAYVLLLGMTSRIPGMPFSLAQAAVRFVTGI